MASAEIFVDQIPLFTRDREEGEEKEEENSRGCKVVYSNFSSFSILSK